METERNFMTEMGIRSDSKLKVHIVDAQNLEEGQHMVKVFQDRLLHACKSFISSSLWPIVPRSSQHDEPLDSYVVGPPQHIHRNDALI